MPLLVGPSQVFWSWLEAGPDAPIDYAVSVLIARDAAGTRLIDHLDAYGFHFYMRPDEDITNYWHAIRRMKATVAAAGRPGMPLYDTEHGKIDGASAGAHFPRRVQRDLLIAAAEGLQMVALYSGDGPNLANPSGGGDMGPAITAIATALAGFTVREGAILEDGRVWLSGMRSGQPATVIA